MWQFQSVARIEQQWGQWYALVTLLRDSSPSSYFIKMGEAEPTAAEAESAGVELARVKSMEEAYVASDSIPREEFLRRFTTSEIASIYTASTQNGALLAYIKRMELTPTINRRNQDVLDGLKLLVDNGLLGSARPDEILRVYLAAG